MKNDINNFPVNNYDIDKNIITTTDKSISKFILYLIEHGVKNIDYKKVASITESSIDEIHFWLENLKEADFFNKDGIFKINNITNNKENEKEYEKFNFEIESAILIAKGELKAKIKTKPMYSLIKEDENDIPIYNGEWFKIMKSKKDGSLYFAKSDSVVILPFFDKDTILCERQYRASINKHLFELPAGSIKKYDYENMKDVVNKKLLEETGYTAKTIHPLFNSFSSPGIYNSMHKFYYAENLEKVGNGQKNIEIKKISLDNAIKYITTGDIQDNKTSLALLYYKNFIQKR